MADKIKLKPCPFCGEEVNFHKGILGEWAILHKNGYWPDGLHDTNRCGYHNCICCAARGYNKRKVAAAWNRRAKCVS